MTNQNKRTKNRLTFSKKIMPSSQIFTEAATDFFFFFNLVIKEIF